MRPKITKIQPGSAAVVIGAGMIGLLAIQAFRVLGCSKVYAVDLEQSRLELARQLGADATFLGTDPELIAKLKTLTDG